MSRLCRLALISLLAGWTMQVVAIEPLPFESAAQRERFQNLTSEIRCMVCQNESLADSSADLASDLRRKIFEMMQAGKTDVEIKQYLVARYSDFVLYDPPLKPKTWLLWFGPGLILLAGALVVALFLRKRTRRATTVPIGDDDW